MGEYSANAGIKNPIKFVVDANAPGCPKNDYGIDSDGPGLMGALGRIGEISALNKATKGLNIFTSTILGVGPGAEKAVNSAGASVLDKMLSDDNATGGSNGDVSFVNRINPDAINNSVAQIESLQEKAKSGNLSFADVPAAARDVADVFRTASNIFNPSGSDDKLTKKCIAPNYAEDLVRFGVKQNYRFVIQFKFTPYFASSLGTLSHTFGAKNCDRPTVAVEYDDVNFYNYRTKVPRKTSYNSISMSLLDDQWSQALDFYNMYLQTISPISNTFPSEDTQHLEQRGMDFESKAAFVYPGKFGGNHIGSSYSGSLGSFGFDTSINIIDNITIYHLYDGGGKTDIYTLYNPKVSEMSLDQLDAAGGSTGVVDFTFEYDAVNIYTYETSENVADEIKTASAGGGFAFNPLETIDDLKYPPETEQDKSGFDKTADLEYAASVEAAFPTDPSGNRIFNQNPYQ